MTRNHDSVRGFLAAQGPAGAQTHYVHDALGRLVATDATVVLVHAGGRTVFEARRSDDQVLREHVWAGASLVRSVRRYEDGGVWYTEELFVHQDRLGSVVLATEKDGSTAGRFLEQDPIGESSGLNLYAYVGSSPTMWVDPTGLFRASVQTVDHGYVSWSISHPGAHQSNMRNAHNPFRARYGPLDTRLTDEAERLFRECNGSDEARWRMERRTKDAFGTMERVPGEEKDEGEDDEDDENLVDEQKSLRHAAGLSRLIAETILKLQATLDDPETSRTETEYGFLIVREPDNPGEEVLWKGSPEGPAWRAHGSCHPGGHSRGRRPKVYDSSNRPYSSERQPDEFL